MPNTPEDGEEPKISWKDSEARKLLYKDIVEGRVPLKAKDESGRSTMKLRHIYSMHPEYASYLYEHFSRRVSSVRSIIKKSFQRADMDERALYKYVQNHELSMFSKRGGYIQWQGSKAQELLKLDLENHLHNTLTKQALWNSREEYFSNFPLKVFCDKLYQEIRTAKYLHTLKVKGKHYKAS